MSRRGEVESGFFGLVEVQFVFFEKFRENFVRFEFSIFCVFLEGREQITFLI